MSTSSEFSARALAAPIVAISIVGMALSISHPLFALLLERMGVSGLVIGLNATASALAMVPSAIVMPLVLARLGLMRLMYLATGAMIVVMLAIPLWENLWWWAAARAVIGFAGTAVFFASEYWIVAVAPDSWRGRVVAVYALVLAGAFMLGPVLLQAVGVDPVRPFLVAAGIIAAALPALAWGAARAPRADADHPPGLGDTLRFFVSDPGILWGVVLFGVLEFGAFSLVSVWGVRSGLAEASAIDLLVALAAGAMLLQIPIGWLSDRADRRVLLAVAAVVSVAAPLAMMSLVPGKPALLAVAFLWGGLAVALYSVALTELGARYSGATLAAGNAAVVLAYGLGALLAPGGFGWMMDLIPPDGLMWLSAGAAAAYLVLILARMRNRPRKSLDTDGPMRR